MNQVSRAEKEQQKINQKPKLSSAFSILTSEAES